MGEYSWMALLSMPVVAALDLLVLRTRVLLTARYWLSMTIVLAFMVLVDGCDSWTDMECLRTHCIAIVI